MIVLSEVDPDLVRDALELAWRNVAPKGLVRGYDEESDV